jgi:hypothetical protein
MRTGRLTAVVAAFVVLFGAACGGSGGPHSGAAPPIAHVSELVVKLGSLGLTCANVDTTPGPFGDKPFPQEQIQCHVAKDEVSILRFRDFGEVSAALRLPRSNNVCAVAKVFHVPNVPYLYGDNWVVEVDPKFPARTNAIARALRAGTWTLHCSG